MPNNALLYLHAITSIHPGSGTALGVVDLPVQRERHTHWPVIPGSSIKGVLRDICNRGNGDKALWEAAFGPERIASGTSESYAGALSITDARLLAFPVRSLKGVFAWVTCPQALQRWKRDAGIAGSAVKLPVMELKEGEALVAPGSTLKVLAGKESLVMEEFVFIPREENLDFFPVLDADQRKRLAVLNDTDFTYFAEHATEVTARIRLNSETKTVDAGALFYQEFLPAETLMYSVVLGAPSRKSDMQRSSEAMLQYLLGQLPEFLQIGGNYRQRHLPGRQGRCLVAIQTLSQQRAKHAWTKVEEQRVRPGFDEFAEQTKKLPIRILTSGLGQTLAFLRAKRKTPEVLEALTDWMQQYHPGNPRDLLERIVQGNSDFQRLATAETLAYLEWLVRFADAHKKE